MTNVKPQPPDYWIVIAGLKGAGKSTLLRHIAENITLRDSQDMSLITVEENDRVLAWLANTGGALDPDRNIISDEERLFHRWMRRVLIGEIWVDTKTRVGFYEAPSTREMDFFWRIITPETYLGALMVLDSTNHAAMRDASRLAAAFAAYSPEPYVFAANKQDKIDAMSADDIRILLQFTDGHLLPVVPCVAHEVESVQKVLLALLELIRDSYDDGIEW